jgi:hypothetical protein
VVIQLKGKRVFRYLLCTPKDAQTFVEQLNSRIGVETSTQNAQKSGSNANA